MEALRLARPCRSPSLPSARLHPSDAPAAPAPVAAPSQPPTYASAMASGLAAGKGSYARLERSAGAPPRDTPSQVNPYRARRTCKQSSTRVARLASSE